MPIANIKQPEIIRIDETLRLRKFDGKYDFAFAWYQDKKRSGWWMGMGDEK